MRLRGRVITSNSLLLGLILGVATIAQAQRGEPHEHLGFLKRVLNEAGATALTSDQETQLNTLITNFRNAQPKDKDETLEAARTAYSNAIIAGDLAAAQAQAAIISGQQTAHLNARAQGIAKFQIDVLAVLKGGGQLDVLRQKLGDERLVRMIGGLAGEGGPFFGGGRPEFGPGGSPRFSHGERPGGIGRKSPQ